MRGRHGVLTYGDATTSEVKRRGNIASMYASGWSRLAGHGPLEEPEPGSRDSRSRGASSVEATRADSGKNFALNMMDGVQ